MMSGKRGHNAQVVENVERGWRGRQRFRKHLLRMPKFAGHPQVAAEII